MPRRVLVTGHAGYIGSAVVAALLAEGYEVTGLDTFYFEDCRLGPDPSVIPAIRKDVRDVTADDLAGFDSVVHLAALCNDPLGDLNAAWTYEINQAASVCLARLARDAGVERFMFASSCSMYGAAADGLVTEDAPLRPLTPYAESKVRAEEEIEKLADSQFSPVFLRNATAYGAASHLRSDLVLNNLACWAYATGRVRILSDGSPWRPVVHIDDIAQAFAVALRAPRPAVHNQAFNVGVNGENYRVRELAEVVQETIPGCLVEYAGERSADPRSYRVDFSKLSRTLPEFQPRWDARRAVEQLHAAFRRVGMTLEMAQGRKCTRLAQFKYLIDGGHLDGSLRWAKPASACGIQRRS